MVLDSVASDPRFHDLAKEGLRMGWLWAAGGPITGDQLADYIDRQEEKGLPLYMLVFRDAPGKFGSAAIVNAVAYAARSAYEAEGTSPMTETIEETSDESLASILECAGGTGLLEADDVASLLGMLEAASVGMSRDELGPAIRDGDWQR